MKLKSKLLISLMLLIILPLITGIGVTYFNIRNSINSLDEKKANDNLESVVKYIDLSIDNHKNSYLTYTQWDDFYNALVQKDTDWITQNILSMQKDYSDSETIIVANTDGSILLENNSPADWKNANFKDFSLFKKFANNPYVNGLQVTSDGLYIVTIVKVVKGDDTNFSNYAGYALYARKIKNSSALDNNFRKGIIDLGKEIIGTNITLKLDNGSIISTSKNNLSVDYKSSDFKSNEIKLFNKKDGDLIKIQTEKVLTDSDNKPVGVLSVETESEAGVAALSQLAKNSIVLVLVLMISVIVLSFAIIQIGLKPLKLMITEFNKIAAGDLTYDNQDSYLKNQFNKKDEIGDFARAFNLMKSNLREMILNINKSVNIVTSTSSTLSEISQTTNQMANETTCTIDTMAKEAAKQSDYSASIMKMMEDAKITVQKGTENLSTVLHSVNTARTTTNNSNKAMKSAVEYMETMSSSLNKSSESIADLKNHSNEIGSIVSAIRNITEQTNLLALNAAIEAARAGESGKGFAVVAEEIRKLSDQSSEETKRIEKLLEDIQFETDLNVKSIEDNVNAFEKQVELVSTGESGLVDVVENINTAEENSVKLQNTLDIIRKHTDNTFENIKKVTDSITGSAQGSEQLSASSQEQLAIINQLAQSAQDLSELAENLETEINKFKL